ncbi:thioredoxin [Candidatus Woesebacteria bacterium]|nr:thioredoxin [Candidatus Woesebacteria bacterium]
MSDTQAAARHISDTEFSAVLEQAGDKPVMVDFYAEWCGPCKIAAPIIEDLAKEYEGKAVVLKVNVDEVPREFSQTHKVMSIPTVIVFKAGKEVERQTGFVGKEKYTAMLESALK